MQFHITRAIREKLKIDGLLFSYTGNVIFANVAASRRLANDLNELRGADADPAKIVNAGALYAMGLIDELNHALVAQYRREIDPAALTEAIRWFEGKIGPENVERRVLELSAATAEMLKQSGAAILHEGGNILAAHWADRDASALAKRLREERIIVAARHGNLRVSPHFYNDENDIEKLAAALRRGPM